MIQEVIERLGQYYTGFINLPLEGQIICGIGAVVVLSAFKNVWKLLFPVRWGAATLLRTAAFLVSPGKKKVKVRGNSDILPFDLSNKKKTKKTYEYYTWEPRVYDLTDEQLNDLDAAVFNFEIRGNGRIGKERRRRGQIVDNEPAPSRELTPPPFDVSSKKKAQAAYDYYAGTPAVREITEAQMTILSKAVTTYGIEGNYGLSNERKRRELLRDVAKLENPSPAPSEDVEALKSYVAKLEAVVKQNQEQLEQEKAATVMPKFDVTKESVAG